MNLKKMLRAIPILLLGFSPLAYAGPNAEINEKTGPILVDGDLGDWTIQPVITMDKKTDVVIGQKDWTGPEYASARVYIAYDKTNMFFATDISSKTPQYNSQNASNIYNGDAIEICIGTDNSNPQRKIYAPTDLQIIISPGKGGDGAEVYSISDKGNVPGAKVATKKTPGGYTLEWNIPLEFLYKLDMGPGKSFGFDISLDDVGATSKVRTVQMTWSNSDKGWNDPSVWGTLTFKGNLVYSNTKPRQAMPGAITQEMEPSLGPKNASTLGMLLYGFNGDMGGFTGKVKAIESINSEGTGALEIDTEGSQGWNQDLAVSSNIPNADKWTDFKALSLDVYMPAGSLTKANWGEIYIVLQSPTNNWYQLKMKVAEGWNRLKPDVDGNSLKGVFKMYIIFNSGGPLVGKAVVDNIRGIPKGSPAVLTGKVTDKATGKAMADAIVAVGKNQTTTGTDGTFKLNITEDEYVAEVFAPGYKPFKEVIQVSSAKPGVWEAALSSDAASAKKALVNVFFNKKVRSFNPHYLFGNNIAGWFKSEWMTDKSALKKIAAVSSYFRLPGGGWSNTWKWKTGEALRKDGVSVQQVGELKWPGMVEFLKYSPDFEPLLTLNIMTLDVQNALDWIADARAKGLKVKYVEMGNEPDYEADMTYQGQMQFWSVIDNYSSKYLEFAKAIRAKYPDIKFMGPACAQVENHERKEGAPWLAPETASWWPDRFLEKCGPYVDVVSVHSYPYWSNDSDSNLLSKTNKWAEFVPKIRAAIKKHCPDRADQIEISVSEWNSGDENSTTARIVNGVFAADYLAQMMLWGVNQSNIWDLMTQKTGLGGGHGVIDPDNDKTRPFAERSHYWALYLMKYHFGTTLYQAVSNNEDLSAYASTGGGKKYLLIINKSSKYAFTTDINMGKTVKGSYKLDMYRLSSKEYQWSENLYRAVINTGPSHLNIPQTVDNRFQYTFPPFSITCVEMTPAK